MVGRGCKGGRAAGPALCRSAATTGGANGAGGQAWQNGLEKHIGNGYFLVDRISEL